MNEKCGCKIVYGHKLHDVGLLTDTVTISYCPLHAAAPLLLEALKEMEWINDDYYGGYCPWCNGLNWGHKPDCQRQAAIAAAEKKE